MRSSGGERQEGIELSKKERERNRLARFRVGRRRTVNIENSEFRGTQFQSERRHFKGLELLIGRSVDNVGGFAHKKCSTTSNYMRDQISRCWTRTADEREAGRGCIA
jgi:hypothetical protein